MRAPLLLIQPFPFNLSPLPLLLLLKLAQEFFAEVAGGDRALTHEEEVELFGGELVAHEFRGLFAQGVDLVFADVVGDGLRRPLRVAEDGRARPRAARDLRLT